VVTGMVNVLSVEVETLVVLRLEVGANVEVVEVVVEVVESRYIVSP